MGGAVGALGPEWEVTCSGENDEVRLHVIRKVPGSSFACLTDSEGMMQGQYDGLSDINTEAENGTPR